MHLLTFHHKSPIVDRKLQINLLSSDLTPADIEAPPPGNWLRRRLGILVCNIDEMLDRDIGKWDDLRLLPELEAKVKNEDNGDVDI